MKKVWCPKETASQSDISIFPLPNTVLCVTFTNDYPVLEVLLMEITLMHQMPDNNVTGYRYMIHLYEFQVGWGECHRV